MTAWFERSTRGATDAERRAAIDALTLANRNGEFVTAEPDVTTLDAGAARGGQLVDGHPADAVGGFAKRQAPRGRLRWLLSGVAVLVTALAIGTGERVFGLDVAAVTVVAAVASWWRWRMR